MDLEKLTADAKVARVLAEAASVTATDAGSSNLDATFFVLGKGQRAEPVIKALRSAGISAGQTRWLGRGLMLSPPGQGQANKRYASNQALYQSLQRSGWPVTPYYQAD